MIHPRKPVQKKKKTRKIILVLHFCGLSGTLDGAPKWVDRSFVGKKQREQK
jgi:hypothetical protein